MSTWRLEEASLGTYTLDTANGIVVVGYDLGAPSPRVTSSARPDASGEDDTTSLHGARVVSLDLRLPGTPAGRQLAAMKLRAFMSPATRTTVVWNSEQYGELRAVGRGDAFAAAVPAGMKAVPVRAAWRVPSGLLEAYAATIASLVPGTGTEVGRSYDLSFDRTYPTQDPPGRITLTNAGTGQADFTVNLYGPCTNPRLRNVTTGGDLDFNASGGLTVAAGDYVAIDTYNRTALLNGTTSVYQYLNFTTLAWTRLRPGANDMRFEPDTSSSPCQAIFTYRSVYL